MFILVAIVLTVYGIETEKGYGDNNKIKVAIVLTVYGIETKYHNPLFHEDKTLQ